MARPWSSWPPPRSNCSRPRRCADFLIRHSERVQVGVQDFLLLTALVGIELAQAHDAAERLGIEARAFRFGIDVTDIVRRRLLVLFETFDALDEGLQLVFGEAGSWLFFLS